MKTTKKRPAFWGKASGCEAAFFCDFHVHTSFSADSEQSPYMVCLRAVQLGLTKVGFSDHLSLYPDDPNFGLLDRFYTSYVETIERCRKEFNNKLEILMGVEVDYHPEKARDLSSFLKDHPFDYVLVSVHHVNGSSLLDKQFYTTRSPELGVRQFVKTLQHAATFPGMDVLAHLDWIKRGWRRYWTWLPYDPQILLRAGLERVLEGIIEQGVVLEINTSGLRRGVEEPFPGKVILSRYREMGGTRCTLGSDAHRTDELGDGIREGFDLARSLGLDVSTPLASSPVERKGARPVQKGKV